MSLTPETEEIAADDEGCEEGNDGSKDRMVVVQEHGRDHDHQNSHSHEENQVLGHEQDPPNQTHSHLDPSTPVGNKRGI
jgi:hypothetical protein